MGVSAPGSAPPRSPEEAPAAPESAVRLESTDGTPLAHWLCTPERLEDLAVGWLRSEGWISGAGRIPDLAVVSTSLVRVDLPSRNAATLQDAAVERGPGPSEARLWNGVSPTPRRAVTEIDRILEDPPRLATLFTELFEGARIKQAVGGGLHTGGRVEGSRIADIVEDVSRSAVVDKLVGAALRGDATLESSLFLLSGRISATIAAKLARAGAAAAATISIPTTLAVEIAGRAGVVLVGRARRDIPLRYGTSP